MTAKIDTKRSLTPDQRRQLLDTLQIRFHKNTSRHQNIDWGEVLKKLEKNPEKLWSLFQMEMTGGEPDVIQQNEVCVEFTFYDCSPESPKGRRSLCYDHAALDSRKEFKPINSAVNMAAEMGVKLLTEAQYRYLQLFGAFDQKTSSWVITPKDIRNLGGAIFCDRRYDTVFTYHNGAESYYAARGFRSSLVL